MCNNITCPDLTNAILDLIFAINALRDELRRLRQTEQTGIEAITNLHGKRLNISADTITSI